MEKIIKNQNYQKALTRPEGIEIREREIIIAYKVISQEMAEELKTMPAQEALQLFKDVLLRLV